MRELIVATPQPRRRARSLDATAGNRAADTNCRMERQAYGGSQNNSSSANNPERSSYHVFFGPAYRGGDKSDREDDGSGPVGGGGGGGGKTGVIAKLGWTDSSGSSNDEVCSYLGDDDRVSGGRVDGGGVKSSGGGGGGGGYGGNGDVGKKENGSMGSSNRIFGGGGVRNNSGGGSDYGGNTDFGKKENGRGGGSNMNSSSTNLSNSNSSSSESMPDLHRDNLLRMVASDALGDGECPDQLQAQQTHHHHDSSKQKDEADAYNQSGDSCSVAPTESKPSAEPLASDSQGEDISNPIHQLEKSKPDSVESLTDNSEEDEAPSHPTSPKNAHLDVENLPADNPEARSHSVNPEKAEQGAKASAVADHKARGSGSVEPQNPDNAQRHVETPHPAEDNRDAGAGSVESGNAKQGVEALAAANASLAANGSGLDEGEEAGQMMVAVDQAEAGSHEDRHVMEILLELESGPPVDVVVVENEELERREGGANWGRSWWVWLWKFFLASIVVSVCAMALWDAGFSTVSVASSNATVVQTATATSPFTRAVDALISRTGPIAFGVKRAPTGGHDRNNDSDDDDVNFKNKKNGNIIKKSVNNDTDKSVDRNENNKVENRNKRKVKNENKTSSSNNYNSNTNPTTTTTTTATATTAAPNKNNNHNNNNNEGGDRAASSSAGEGADNNSRRSDQNGRQRSRGERKERWRKRWAAWGAEFEEILDGPWV